MESIQKNSVLVVDDEKLNLEILSKILQSEYTVYVTKNGKSAIEMAQKYSPDLILLDIIMPDMDGFEVLSRLKALEKTQNIPVIFITGLDSVEFEEKGLDMGAADYMPKPFHSRIVKLKVRNQMQIVNQIRTIEEYAHNMQITLSKLEEAVKAAENANKAKSDFLAKMSHEIRTPLNAVLGISEIQLQNGILTQDVQEAFARIHNSGDLLLGIINDILDMSKIEAGKLELITSEYDISSMINDSVFINLIKYENKPIEFILNLDENLPSRLFGDELRIKQILNNLLSNAFKYTKKGEVSLSIGFENSADESLILVLIIKDSGQGMNPEQLGKLFNDYARFNVEANRTIEGTGLGMSITKNLISMMNGEINAESEVNKGSVFIVRLPQGRIDAPAIGRQTVENLKQFRQTFESRINKIQIVREPIPFGKVLVVDDMEMNHYVARSMLSLYGLQIDTAISGFEAIEKIKSLHEGGGSYDIIFMDHMMPVMDGITAAKEIRKLGADFEKLPIIALTANALTGVKEMFLANGMDGFISKPVNIQELDTVLKQWMQPDKINQSESINQSGEINNKENEDLFNKIAGVSEIKAETGLSNASGKIDIYKNTLIIFNNKLASECAKMSDLLKENDLHNFEISVHAMKSMLAIIGASVLSKKALELETASANGGIEYCRANFPGLMEELLSLQKKLADIFSEQADIPKTNAQPAQEKTGGGVYKGNALLVDDMDMILYVVKEKLISYGLQVDTALSGSEALGKFQNNSYDIIFMDQMMPEMDGTQTAGKIRDWEKEKKKAGIPIIMLTASDAQEIKETLYEKGFNGFLSKPVRNKELEIIFNKWLMKKL